MTWAYGETSKRFRLGLVPRGYIFSLLWYRHNRVLNQYSVNQLFEKWCFIVELHVQEKRQRKTFIPWRCVSWRLASFAVTAEARSKQMKLRFAASDFWAQIWRWFWGLTCGRMGLADWRIESFPAVRALCHAPSSPPGLADKPATSVVPRDHETY